MAYSVFDTAKYVVSEYEKKESGISNLKLQKVLFYVQMNSLNKTGCVFFDAAFEAWRHGPVINELYSALKKYISTPISLDDNIFKQAIDIDPCDTYLINEIIDITLDIDPWKLVDYTHETKAWKDSYLPRCNNTIPISDIASERVNIGQTN
ncbi:MAG: hypothetical protein BI182_08420 [Acetobacterium sp. MES1]|uniref:Panacea domain-containing protein n=1 Tax=Acetobacterium sp. MES1 TaxID=1899015 RepID=UPI000B9CB2C1|nr:type II toxin-antitoxin system antitoxin SocA domain-containing protein [Acetobacterium sp. MES1]OXS26408.1 MAG: hypothetical protein BI182_08420 [Acetobacterium sp. MES1]